MKKTLRLILLVAASTFVAACGAPAVNTGANDANTSTTKPVAVAPGVDALMALEKQANEAYLNGDSKFFEGMLSDKFVILTGGGQRMDKATTVKMIAGVKCDIKSMDLTEPAMSRIDADTYALSYKATWDGTCNDPDGKPMKVPSPIRSASIWIRSGDKWQAVFHGENVIVDLKAPPQPPAPAAKKEEPQKEEQRQDDKTAANSNAAPNTAAPAPTSPAASPDANTDSLVKVELALWEAWKARDAKKLDDLMAKDVSFVNIFGTYLGTKADAMKDWTGNNCEIKSVSVTDGFATTLSPTVEMLTRKGTAEGTCSGQDVGGTDIWGVSVFVRDGDAWKFAFGMNLAAM
ncbi:MAG TPA: nuclear transport factor 2 family protein [Pyrinomonadaceae bacterium]|nr:nuclear transport factor 2 family protein [Pyrinomonadaceae bacterium]